MTELQRPATPNRALQQTAIFTRHAYIAAALILAFVAIMFVGAIYRHTEAIAEESGQQALLAEVNSELREFQRQHGSFPLSLSELHITRFGDGSSPATLQQFYYTSDGASFILRCIGASSQDSLTYTDASPLLQIRP